jgi:hypothetical protein
VLRKSQKNGTGENSMIAIDMPMPNNCCDCPVNDHDAWCGITLTEFGDDFCKIRLPDCPLIDLTDDGK